MASDNSNPTAASPAPPPADKPEAAAKASKSVHVVWCAPGYENRRIGGVYKGPAEAAARLAKAGTVRPATPEEVRAAEKAQAIGAF